jgi:hypothetical protein
MANFQNTRHGFSISMTGLLAIMVPAALALGSIKTPGTLSIPTDNPSPYGYTISLLLFFVPNVVLLVWLLNHPEAAVERKAFFATIAAVFAVGCVLDFFFAYDFFYYSNTGATLGIRLPAWSFHDMKWHTSALPIEEFGFYAGGAFFMTALYVWADLRWLTERVNALPSLEQAQGLVGKPWWKIFKFDWRVFLVGLVICVIAIAYRRAAVPEPGFPGYFILLMCIGFIPTVMLFETVEPLVNWQAFTLMFTVLQLVSLLWEATLGVPYNWWNYHHNQMVGVFVGAWAQLPVESIMMWILGGWATTIAYEAFRVVFYSQQLTASATATAASTSRNDAENNAV